MKKYLKTLIIASIVILLPVLAGLLLWPHLPEQMPSHWNAQGQVDGWSSKPFVVFGLPLILLAAQWLCILGSFADPKREAHPKKVVQMVFWIIPTLSVLLFSITYAVALGKSVRVEVIMPVAIGLLLTVIGNYLPKCKQNYTIGIKIPWTLNSEENWNRTHRFAGRLWVVCGLIITLTGFFGGFWIFLAIALLMVLLPFAYSYMLSRKGI